MSAIRQEDQNPEMSLLGILEEIQRKWGILLTFIVASLLIATVYAFMIPNMYKSEVVVSPSESGDSNALSGMASSLSSVVSLTGLSMGTKKIDELTIALETMVSRTFLTQFVEKHDLLPELMAVTGWDEKSDHLQYNTDIYDPEKREWKIHPESGLSLKPSSWNYIPKLRERIVMTKNPETGILTIHVTHVSPTIAHRWITALINDINDYMRTKDINEANRSIEYLQAEISDSSLTEMKSVFYSLIEQQIRTGMIASVRPDYVLKVIDPAIIPEGKDSPKRELIIIFGAILGAFIGVFFIMFRYLIASSSPNN